MNANDYLWLILPVVFVLCVLGLVVGLSLPRRMKARLGTAILVPLQFFSTSGTAWGVYRFLVHGRHWGNWGVALGFVCLFAAAFLIFRDLWGVFDGAKSLEGESI